MMIAVRFRSAIAIVTEPATVSVFSDGQINRMPLDQPGDHPYFALAAGYGKDWRRYIVEHDLIHHWLADRLQQPYSHALHDGDGSVPLCRASQIIQDEEHLVQQFQRLLMLGQQDPYRQLERHFGLGLAHAARSIRQLLDETLGPFPRHLPQRA